VRTAFQQDHGAPAGDNLEEDDAEAVDVRVGAQVVRVDELRIDVPCRAHHGPSGVPPCAVITEPGKAEVAEPGAERVVQHDVAGLDVAVHHALLPLLMEIPQC
jgi:hypothetical protein